MKSEKAHCRVCLQYDLDIDGAGGNSSIFDKSDTCFIYEKLNSIAEVNIKPKDGLPDKICGECLLELENAINFKLKCETSNSILLSAASAGDALKGEEAPEDDVKEEPDEYIELEYLEEEPESPPEVPLKPEDTDDEEQSLSSPKLEETDDQKKSRSSPELTIPEASEEREQLLSSTEIHLELSSRPSRAFDLQLECHDCGSFFKSKCKLRVHWFKVHLKTQLTCNICKRVFGSFKNLKEHKINRSKKCMTLSQVRIETKGKSHVYHCKECVFSTSYIETMSKHLAVHSGELDYACTLCPASYVYLNSLDAHMESKHGVLRKSIVCNICGEKFGHRQFYTHIRKHKVNGAAKCNVCNKVFKQRNYLKIHMERHEGVKKHACDKCGKSFVTADSLYHHERFKHGNKNDITYNCNICEFTINSRNIMDRHKLKHSKYDYVCTTCGKFFENATQLSCHKERHINNNPCQHCEKSFNTRKSLLRHMNKIHNIYCAKTGKKVVKTK